MDQLIVLFFSLAMLHDCSGFIGFDVCLTGWVCHGNETVERSEQTVLFLLVFCLPYLWQYSHSRFNLLAIAFLQNHKRIKSSFIYVGILNQEIRINFILKSRLEYLLTKSHTSYLSMWIRYHFHGTYDLLNSRILKTSRQPVLIF